MLPTLRQISPKSGSVLFCCLLYRSRGMGLSASLISSGILSSTVAELPIPLRTQNLSILLFNLLCFGFLFSYCWPGSWANLCPCSLVSGLQYGNASWRANHGPDVFEVVMLVGACFLINYITADSKTNWAEGYTLISFYLIIVSAPCIEASPNDQQLKTFQALVAWFYDGQEAIHEMVKCTALTLVSGNGTTGEVGTSHH
jgi:hypothetical protein